MSMKVRAMEVVPPPPAGTCHVASSRRNLVVPATAPGLGAAPADHRKEAREALLAALRAQKAALRFLKRATVAEDCLRGRRLVLQAAEAHGRFDCHSTFLDPEDRKDALHRAASRWAPSSGYVVAAIRACFERVGRRAAEREAWMAPALPRLRRPTRVQVLPRRAR